MVRKDPLPKTVEKPRRECGESWGDCARTRSANRANSGKWSAAGNFDRAAAGFFQRVRLEILLGVRVALQIRVPESKGRGIGVVKNISALLSATRSESAWRDERHVVRAFHKQVIFVAGLAALEGSFVPCRTRYRAKAVERSGHAHVRQ